MIHPNTYHHTVIADVYLPQLVLYSGEASCLYRDSGFLENKGPQPEDGWIR